MIRTLCLLVAFLVVPLSVLAEGLPKRKLSFSASSERDLLDFCCAANITCSIELDVRGQSPDALRHRSPTDFKNISAGTALRTLMRRYHGHTWEFKDEMLTVAPGTPLRDNPLDKPLGPVTFKTESIENVQADIFERAKLDSIQISSSAHRRASEKRVTYSAPNPTAREVFTVLVRQYGHAAWSVRHETTRAFGPVAVTEVITYDNQKCSLPQEASSGDD